MRVTPCSCGLRLGANRVSGQEAAAREPETVQPGLRTGFGASRRSTAGAAV